jgi:DNA-binding NtrC family response regulator
MRRNFDAGIPGGGWLFMASTTPSDLTIEIPTTVSHMAAAQASLPFLAAEQTESAPRFQGITGRSPVMRQLILQMQRMAPHLVLATIEGEEGTGKTLAAQSLHAGGPVAEHGPFVPCLATHFFSGADHAGPSNWSTAILQQAHAGMLFLDRIHQLSASQQESLFELLVWFEDRLFQDHSPGTPIGHADPGASLLRAPAQIVCSSSVPLRHLEAEGRFRHDLVSRLCSVRFRLPPLIERREDIPLLAQLFVQRFARTYGKTVRGLGPGTIAPLMRYSWPGNVRELESVIVAAALETESQWIRPIDLPPISAGPRHHPRHADDGPDADDLSLDRIIRQHVARVLDRTRGNKLRAAQLLGISRSTLYRILAAQDSDPQSAERETP